MSGQIAEFWASLGIKVDKKELDKVDKFLDATEKKLKGRSKAKSEEAKATESVTKQVKAETAAKVASTKADVAAAKAVDQKTKAVKRLTTAEREAQRIGARLRSTPFVNTAVQSRINAMFPAMGRRVLPQGSQDRRLLNLFYKGAFDQAERRGRVLQALPVVRGAIGEAVGGRSSKVADKLRQSVVEPEASALRSLGTNNPRFRPLGSAFQEYDERLERAVATTRAQMAERSRLRNLGLMEQRMSHLGPVGKSPELRSMAEFYRRQSKEALSTAREEVKLKREGLRSEEGIERSRRRSLVEQRRNIRTGMLAGATPTRTTNLATFGRSAANHSSGNYLRAGGATGAFARYGVGSLPFIGGAYGFSTLNRSNQEAISARLTTQAVVQSQGLTEEQGVEAFDWLRRLGQDIGFNYMDSAQDYNQFLSNSLGAGLSIEGSQDIFRGVSEYQTAMGVTSYRRKLINNALNQMLGKGILSMEEVNTSFAV